MPGSPFMYVVAGPAGSGKSRLFPSRPSASTTSTSTTPRRRSTARTRTSLPSCGRGRDARARTSFGHIAAGRSFAVETALRTAVSIEQARAARAAGFTTALVFAGASDAAINVERVRIRGLMGGHSAPPALIREIYTASLANLRPALDVFDIVRIYDNSTPDVAPSAVSARVDASVAHVSPDAPAWVLRAVEHLFGR